MRFVSGRVLGRLFLQGMGVILAASITLTLLFRWVPVPWSSLMIQRQMAASWQGDQSYRLAYTWVSLEQISLYALQAVIAAEDQRFFDHNGFDFGAMNKAWQANEHRRRPLGASTISQQVAKNLYLWPGRTFVRKGLEAYVTLLLEGLWPKRRILEVYLNVAEFGPGVFGVEAASRAYFHKSAARLTLTEATLLAAILPSPLRSDLAHPTSYALSRSRHIQRQMKLMNSGAYLKQMVRPEQK
jgi:monofunctional biosynthetic peptidoglycan transglycosylase